MKEAIKILLYLWQLPQNIVGRSSWRGKPMLTRSHHRRSRGPGTIVFSMAFLFLLPGCGLLRPRERIVTVTETVTQYRDSTAWRDTTIYVPIPLEADQAIVHVGDTSHRETSVATSDAWVGADGFLHHDLRNKPGRIAHGVKLPEHFLVSNVKNTKERAEIITKEVKVERPLNFWQRFKIGAFWWLLALAAIGWRKPLLAIFKRIASAVTGH